MFASMDLNNGWTIASRVESIGFTDEAFALIRDERAHPSDANRFREAMLNAAKNLFEAECGRQC
jgi:hypothetical protein